MQNSYWRKNYTMTVQEASDALNLSKLSDSDWCSLTMRTNDFDNGSITIRSQAMAEQLHFMLGQMLSSNVELTGAGAASAGLPGYAAAAAGKEMK